MLKILSTEQIKEADSHTLTREPIAAIDLMERASRAVASWLMKQYDGTYQIGVVCGTGNNGGDGLAVARILLEYNYRISVWVVSAEGKETIDFITNRKRLEPKISIATIQEKVEKNCFQQCDILVDALFGTGLTRSVEGIYQQVIEEINQTKAVRVAVDVPSGLFTDKLSEATCIRAHHTITFQLPKLAFLLPENYEFVGEWHVVKIGLDKKFIAEASTDFLFLEKKDGLALVKPRKKFDHKGTYGKALLISGSMGKMGAAILSAKAALRSGVGLLTTHIPACGYESLQTSIPESMVSVDAHTDYISTLPSLQNFTAIGMGPGIGQALETKKVLKEILQKSTSPLVLDADALNLMAGDKALLKLLPENAILTPHPGEFMRLAGTWRNDFERLALLREFSQQLKCIVVLKGANTSIATPEGKVYFNSTGNPGMATAGSGDVLLGIITGLLAQKYQPLEAALAGVYLHGLAGDLAAQALSEQALIASDIIDFMPNAYRELR